MKLRALAWIALACAIGGCSGGGSSPLTVPLDPKVRIMQKGDTASYSFTGTFTATGKPPVKVMGSTVHTISDKVGGLLTVVHDLHIVIDGAPFDVHQVGTEKQNPDGSIEPVSDNAGANGASRTVVTNTYVQPGTLSVPLTVSGSTTFSDGSSSQTTMNVVGTAVARTLLGSFAVYLVKGSMQSSYGNSDATVDLFCPPIGFFITRTETATSASGVITLNYAIQSYALAP